ncbi:hypothetical protein [Oryzifoliimicrobium ureilyticus]|uniref:hypothetical protein n=1 Tax=Oryzifoliimicrobium ureilyticus TaxID=3113724 RepID=UPI0030765FE9
MPPKKIDNGTAGESGENQNSLIDAIEKMGLKTEEEFKKLYPLLHALIAGWQSLERPVLKVISRVAGFRRGGIAHPTEAVLHDMESMHPDQVEQILAEPNLVAELVPAPASGDGDDKASDDAKQA